METKIVKVPQIDGEYKRTLGETDNRLILPGPFLDAIIERNYANLSFNIREGNFKITPNGVLHKERLLYSFDSPFTDEVIAVLRDSPDKLFSHFPLDTAVFGTVTEQELECRAWLDYLIAQSRGQIKSGKTYQMDPDSSGRVVIPKEVKDELGLAGAVSVILTGMTDHFVMTKKRPEVRILTYRS